jgi:Leucine-rich repeat (LRR) protein
MKRLQYILLSLALIGAMCGCKNDTDVAQSGYGYAQFRLFKNGSYNPDTRGGVGIVDFLYDAAKIQLTLHPLTGGNGSDIRQTVPLEAQNPTLAEYGMQSDKFLLLAGDYEVVSFALFDKLDAAIPNFQGVPDSKTVVTVVPGGLTLQDIVVNTRERGGVKFRLAKANVDEITPTRAATAIDDAFHTIKAFDVTLRNDYLNIEHTYEKMDVRHEYFRPEDRPDHYTSEAVCDSIVTGLRGGTWRVSKARVYYDDINYVMFDELTTVADNSFTVEDNGITEVKIPVTLDATALDIKDAIVLKKIWEALDGPNWRVKWDFNRDIDLWAAQPGVSVLSNGRVAAIDLSDMGAKGDMPAEIGQLTELRQLYLGSHNWLPSAGNLTPSAAAAARQKPTIYNEAARTDLARSFRETFIERGDPLHKFSKELQGAFVLNGDLSEVKERPATRDLVASSRNFSNMITSLPDEINNLKNLSSLYLGYSAIERLPDDMSGLTSLTDFELFNCPNITTFPEGIPTLPTLYTLVMALNENLPKQEMYDGLVALAAGAAGKTIQALQISGQKVDAIPNLQAMNRLGQFDIQNCGVTRFEAAFTENQVVGIFNASHNELTELPTNNKGHFMGLNGEIERLNFSNNKFTKLPDIFDAKSEWKMINIDFSFNQISSVENGVDAGGTYKGLVAEILSLGYNKFEKFPREILHSGSNVQYLQLQGNSISIGKRASSLDLNHPDEDWFERSKAPHAANIAAIDLSYNKLDRLPASFGGLNLPFVIGIDLSYNRFSSVPMSNTFNIPALTTFVFRGQRDENGNRIMRTWPTGVYAHKGLRALYLGSNDIREVNDRIPFIWSAFEISDNPNISIDISELCYYISVGMMFAYDPWQDIKGCPSLRLDK